MIFILITPCGRGLIFLVFKGTIASIDTVFEFVGNIDITTSKSH
jgi:hypothetical protein